MVNVTQSKINSILNLTEVSYISLANSKSLTAYPTGTQSKRNCIFGDT